MRKSGESGSYKTTSPSRRGRSAATRGNRKEQAMHWDDDFEDLDIASLGYTEDAGLDMDTTGYPEVDAEIDDAIRGEDDKAED